MYNPHLPLSPSELRRPPPLPPFPHLKTWQLSRNDMHLWWQAVDELLQVIGQDGALQVPCPSWHYQDQGSQAQPSPSDDSTRQLPLAEALTKCYDLRSASP